MLIGAIWGELLRPVEPDDDDVDIVGGRREEYPYNEPAPMYVVCFGAAEKSYDLSTTLTPSSWTGLWLPLIGLTSSCSSP